MSPTVMGFVFLNLIEIMENNEFLDIYWRLVGLSNHVQMTSATVFFVFFSS